MFIAIPLQNKPSWRSPPWMTALLIVINCLVYFGWQVPKEKAVERMAGEYARTPLTAIEGLAFVRHLQARAQAFGKSRAMKYTNRIGSMVESKLWPLVYERIWSDWDFRQRLLAGQIIKPGSDGYDGWRAAREKFTLGEPRPFTPRWSQNHDAGTPLRHVTWLTSVFLHGSFEHLLGNMVFCSCSASR
jgi:hypothetical protein